MFIDRELCTQRLDPLMDSVLDGGITLATSGGQR
ncbi:hypothetical protein EDC15_1111, partial [Acetobacter aceti NBRC 14818]